MFADTAVTTTHFLKKCIQVPKVSIVGEKDTGEESGIHLNKEQALAEISMQNK